MSHLLLLVLQLTLYSSWGPGGWVIIGELFQLPIRSRGVALSTASNWFWNCIIGVIVPYIVDPEYGNLSAKVFFIWGGTCAGCILFAYFFIPETVSTTFLFSRLIAKANR